TKQPLELLTHITLPPPRGWRAHYIKLRRRGSFDFPVLGVAAAARFEDGRVTAARIRVGGVGSNPRANPEAERRLVGSTLDDEAIAEAARLAAVPVRPLDNTDFVMGWRKKVTAVHVRRALERLREPALA
ncbi:MAG: 4-hydroxybenzoyl-CoA reductase, partial [Planctomycetota bacterium]